MKPILLALGLTLLGHGVALAETAPCRAPQAAVGAEVRGPVLHVIDGRTLCVATTADPSGWIRLELADAPQATRAELMSVGFGKDVVCTVGSAGALCRSAGQSLSAQLRAPGVKAASAAWRAQPSPVLTKVQVATAY